MKRIRLMLGLVILLVLPFVVHAEYTLISEDEHDGVKLIFDYQENATTGKIDSRLRLINQTIEAGSAVTYSCDVSAESIDDGVVVSDYGQFAERIFSGDTQAEFNDCTIHVYAQDKIVTSVNIEDITPVYGEYFETNYTSTTEAVDEVSVDWSRSGVNFNDSLIVYGPFLADITVTLKDGYVWGEYVGLDSEFVMENVTGFAAGAYTENTVSKAKEFVVGNPLTMSIDPATFFVDRESSTIGDTINFGFKITSNATTLDDVKVYFANPNNDETTEVSLEYNEETEEWVGVIEVDSTWQSGRYYIDWIYCDTNDISFGPSYSSLFNNANPNTLSYELEGEGFANLNGLYFEIYGTDPDIIPPVIDGSSLQVSNRKAIIGDKIKYSIKVTDNDHVSGVTIALRNKDDEGIQLIHATYNEETDAFEGEFNITSDTSTGMWDIFYVAAWDDSENGTNVVNKLFYPNSTNGYMWSDMTYSINNYGEKPVSSIVWNSIERSSDSVDLGDSISISVSPFNVVGITGVRFYYRVNDSVNMAFDATYESSSENPVISSYGIKTYSDKYTLNLDLDDQSYIGTWDLNKIEVYDERGGMTYFTDSHIDLSAGDFEVTKSVSFHIDPADLFVDRESATVGDHVTFGFKATSNTSSIDNVLVYFTKPINKLQSEPITMEYNQADDTWEATVEITDDWQSGRYYIDWIYYSTSDPNYDPNYGGLYNNANLNGTGYNLTGSDYANLNGLYFEVYDTHADVTPPVIDGSSLRIDSRKAVYGDSIKYSISINEDREVDTAILRLINADTRNTAQVDLYYNEISGLYEGYFEVYNFYDTGIWNIYYLSASDTSGNSSILVNALEFSGVTNSYLWSNMEYSVNNYGDIPLSAMMNNSLTKSKNTVTPGDSITVSVDLYNEIGISSVTMYYTMNGLTYSYNAEHVSTSENPVISMYGIKTYSEKYAVNINFDEELGHNGDWSLYMIEVLDQKGGTTQFMVPEVDLSAGSFVSEGFTEDDVDPVIDNVSLDHNVAHYNETVRLTVQASDDVSGIDSVRAIVNGDSYPLLKLDDGEYYYDFTYYDVSQANVYNVEKIIVVDKANNQTDYEPGDLVFEFIPPLKIVGAPHYLDKYTTYNLKALDVYTGKYYEDISWASSNTGIVTINSSTGVMTSTGTNGTAYVTAYANDGSIYGTIEFIINGGAIRVLQATSLSNSNPVGYSDVTWQIDDESILMRTNKYGHTAINGQYTHSIEVIGLKEGSTRLKMLAPSGAIILNAMVYVYDEVTSINTDVESLDLGKGMEHQLDYSVDYASGKSISRGVTFISEDPTIATVDENGNVKGIKGGTTNIKLFAEYSTLSVTIPVTVSVKTNEITVDSDEVTLNEDNPTHQITYEVKPDDAVDKSVTFTSSDSNIATVSEDGLITGLRNGTVTITVAAKDGGASKVINVTVEGLKREITDMEFEAIPDATYTGSAIEPALVIVDEDDYHLVKDTDYTVTYANNTNVGTGTITVTGIGSYKGTKELTFNIKKAAHDLPFNSYDQIYTYDGKPHGLNIDYDGTIKYANEDDEYILDEMPTYINAGEYTIKFMLTQDGNHENVYGSNKVFINKAKVNVEVSTHNVVYDGNEHSLDIKLKYDGEEIDEDEYTLTYRYGSALNYDAYFAENYTPYIELTDSETLPKLKNPGFYIIMLNFSSTNYEIEEQYLNQEFNIKGISGYDPKKFEFRDNLIIVKKHMRSYMEILTNVNLIYSGMITEVDGYLLVSTVKTGGSFAFTLDGFTQQLLYYTAVLGDVNGDGDITPLDYVRIKNHIMETAKITNNYQKIAADYNEDNQISPLDYVKVKNYIMNGGN